MAADLAKQGVATAFDGVRKFLHAQRVVESTVLAHLPLGDPQKCWQGSGGLETDQENAGKLGPQLAFGYAIVHQRRLPGGVPSG
jgi:hypothetical protein